MNYWQEFLAGKFVERKKENTDEIQIWFSQKVLESASACKYTLLLDA